MENNLSQDADSSFELFEPIVVQNMPSMTPSIAPSMTPSMSIVTIPDEYRNSTALEMSNSHINGMSNALQMSQNTSLNEDNNLETNRIQSFVNSFQIDCRIEDQELMSEKLSHFSSQLDEEMKASLKTLDQLEANIDLKSNSVSNNLENYLKELRDENEKLKSLIEKNNHQMKHQLKHLQEWQQKTNESNEQNMRSTLESKAVIEKLKEENSKLKNQVMDLEGMAGLKLVEEMSTELAELRSKCDQMSTYDKLNVSSELQSQELNAQLVGAKQTITSLNNEVDSLRKELNEALSKIESLPIMKSQLELYERDFKMEEMAKVAALKEVEALEKEVDRLKKCKTELEEKLEKGEPILNLKAEPTGQKSYTCPKCWNSFERFQAIQNHFERCVEQDGLFT